MEQRRSGHIYGVGEGLRQLRRVDDLGRDQHHVGSTPTQPPQPADPTGWQSADVGNPYPAGSATYSAGTFTITAAGNDIWDRNDQLHYVYWPLQGDGGITACVQSVGFADAWTKAGVMIRGSLSAGARTPLRCSPPETARHSATGRPNHSRSAHVGQSPSVAPHCVRIVRSGSVFRAYQSVNGTSWNLMGEQTINMPSPVLIGLALTSAAGRHRDSETRHASPLENSTTTNQAPQVSLTAPANGTTYTSPATMNVSANASDADGTIAAVEFYAGSTLIGSDSSSPFAVAWSNAPSGTHSLTAIARDNAGATTTSSPRQVTISAPSNTPPSVSLSSPANGATFTAPAVRIDGRDGDRQQRDDHQGRVLCRLDSGGNRHQRPFSATWSTCRRRHLRDHGEGLRQCRRVDDVGRRDHHDCVDAVVAAAAADDVSDRMAIGGHRQIPGRLAARTTAGASSPSRRPATTSGARAINSATSTGRCRVTGESPPASSRSASRMPGPKRAS